MDIPSAIWITCSLCKRKMELLCTVFLIVIGLNIACAETVSHDSALFVKWPLVDSSAPIGKIFQYHIPQDTFEGTVKSYQVFELNKGILPDWLHFDEKIHVLSGIPLSRDKGQYRIEVTAYGDKQTNKAIDVFSIFVKDDQEHTSSVKPLKSMGKTVAKEVNCGPDSPLTSVTIVVDTDFDQFYPEDRLKFVRKFAKHLNLAPEMMKLSPVSGRPTFDGSALVAGPGNAKTTQFGGVFASWLVGCGNVETDHMPVLQKVEDYAADGSMARDVEHPIVSWHVSNIRTENSDRRRNRRAVVATPTPLMTIPPPTEVINTIMMTDLPSMIKPSMTIDIKPTSVQSDIKPTKMPDGPITPTKMCNNENDVDQAPYVNKPLGRITANVLENIRVKMPVDTFDDCEDTARGLNIEIFDNVMGIPDWVEYDKKKRVLNLLPLKTDAGERTLVIIATDKGGHKVSLDIKVNIEKPKKDVKEEEEAAKTLPVEFIMTLNMDYATFTTGMRNRVILRRKLNALVHQRNDERSVIQFTRIERGSTIVGWTIKGYKNLPNDECPEAQIRNTWDKFVHDNRTLKKEIRSEFERFGIKQMNAFSGGACERQQVIFDETAVERPIIVEPEETADKPPTTTMAGPKTGKSSDSNVWVTTVVPAVVIVALLLIALLIACILYRKRRQGKMSTAQDQHTHINKKAPSVFQTEMSEKANDTGTEPLIGSDENNQKPNHLKEYQPAPPPYEPNNHSTLERDRVDEYNENTGDDAALFKHPPPLTASHETKQPPKSTAQSGMSPTNIGP